MAQSDSRRLNMVLPYLYPDMNIYTSEEGKKMHMVDMDKQDYVLRNDGDDTGTYLIWQNSEIPEPTEQELADAKEPAINAGWWMNLRGVRDRLLIYSDWSQGTDIPSELKASYATYRQELRDLPANVTKPAYEVLVTQSIKQWHLGALMPREPER